MVGSTSGAATLFGTALPNACTAELGRAHIGRIALAAFLLVQGLDGLFTYLGVRSFGIGIEANPILASLMAHLGHAPALVSAKVFAAGLGVCLHLQEIHSVLALLTGLYLTVSIAPWTFILFF